jgi:hypothetical protein
LSPSKIEGFPEGFLIRDEIGKEEKQIEILAAKMSV